MAFEKLLGDPVVPGKRNSYRDVSLSGLNALPYSVYILDYEWRYMFVNDNAKKVLGVLAEEMIGRSALEISKSPVFNEVFEMLSYHLFKKLPLEVTTYSPLRVSQTRIKGYPLHDCYVLCSIPLPAKAEVMNELREELKKRKA